GIDVYGAGMAAAITDSTISNNTAASAGGIYFGPGNMRTLANSTVVNNKTAGTGGGIIVNDRTSVTVSNSTIAGNSAAGAGGGIDVRSGYLGIPGVTGGVPGGTLTLLNSTVANNQAGGTGGGLWVGATRTQVMLANTIVAGNTAATGGPDVSGPVLSTSAYNLVGNGDGSTGLANGTNGNQVGTTASPIDPRLGPLQDNGGPPPPTTPLPGSTALHAGSNGDARAGDQRGFARSGAASDIGAFEVQPATQVTRLRISAPAGAVAGTPGTVTVQAVNDLGNAVPGFTVHFTSSDGQAVLPADYTFKTIDVGTHTFSVTLKTAGSQSITAADTL